MSTTSSQIRLAPLKVPIDHLNLSADIAVPADSVGLVVFAHGSGSGRYSPRNRHVAEMLNQGRIATVLIDLLTEQEESVDVQTGELRFDIDLLSGRLVAISDWIGQQPALNELGLGYFGASTGAAAALVAAAARSDIVRAVVSRGGRPDLAGDALRRVIAPTLFIVGSRDTEVLDLNYSAIAHLPRKTERKVEIVRGATHLFEEPGALDQVATLSRNWFQRYLRASKA